jgi:hypothetical protein
MVIFFTADDVPVHNSLLLPTRAEALAFPRGNLRLGHCPSCGFVQNTAFDAELLHYGPGYEDSQAHSPRFMAFASELAQSLIDEHGVRNRAVLEVGSGKGDFLDLICRLGDNRGIGYDPATDPAEAPASIDHRAESFTAETPIDQLDLLVCRHTLEHIADVSAFAAMLSQQLARHPRAVAYLEVPDTMRILREGAFWDIYYEHCSYFTQASLLALLQRNGLRPIRSGLGFDGQYVQIEFTSAASEVSSPSGSIAARGSDGAGTRVAEMAVEVGHFVSRITELRATWRDSFDAWAAAGRRVVLWGGGSKAVGFLTTLGLDDEVAGVVDINPRKHGRYLPGTGHEVLDPGALDVSSADVIIVMNPIYLSEIRGDLRSRGLAPEVLAA